MGYYIRGSFGLFLNNRSHLWEKRFSILYTEKRDKKHLGADNKYWLIHKSVKINNGTIHFLDLGQILMKVNNSDGQLTLEWYDGSSWNTRTI